MQLHHTFNLRRSASKRCQVRKVRECHEYRRPDARYQSGAQGEGRRSSPRGKHSCSLSEEVWHTPLRVRPYADFCMIRFTQPEKLSPKEYSCGKCGKAAHVRRHVIVEIKFLWRTVLTIAQEASKRLSIRKLPPVLSFQFKVVFICMSLHLELIDRLLKEVRTQNQ